MQNRYPLLRRISTICANLYLEALPTHQILPSVCGVHGAGNAKFCPQDDSFTCTGTYFITQDAMDAGTYDTTSIVTSISPNGSFIANATDHSAQLVGAVGISIGERVLAALGKRHSWWHFSSKS